MYPPAHGQMKPPVAVPAELLLPVELLPVLPVLLLPVLVLVLVLPEDEDDPEADVEEFWLLF